MKKTILLIVLAALCSFFKLFAQNNPHPPTSNVIGKVTDEQGQPLPGATIKLKGTNIIVITDQSGTFRMAPVSTTGILAISFVSYQTTEINFNTANRNPLAITLKADDNSLNEVQVIGYGTTTKRLNTGSVSTISSAELEKQPVTNVLSAISGRTAGVFVQQTNGLPGGGISIQIRGKGSIAAGTNPLYVIDGVPFSANPITFDISYASPNGSVSPFNSINPDDIESISILKDVDATAIYGSRGANGVVLITTKKGKAGKTKADFNLSDGFNSIASLPSVLSLQQYLQLRREAFKNDGLTPSSDPTSSSYAPDLTIWSQNESTNFGKYVFGGIGHVSDFQGTISGGDKNTTFSIGGNYHSETTVLKGDNLYRRGGIRYNLQHKSLNEKFSIALSGAFVKDDNRLISPASFESDIFLPPNFPLTTADGSINWSYGINPLADVKRQSKVKTDNFVTNLVLKYDIFSDLSFNSSFGYNKINIDQIQTFPQSSKNPRYSPVSSATFDKSSNQSVIIEPQFNYKKQIKNSTLNVLAGGTFQSSLKEGELIEARNFSNDKLLQNLSSAGSIDGINNSYLQYKNISVFGRINYNFDNKYIINASIRRDGSSRFGPGNQFGTFGAVGGAWLFSQEDFVKNNLLFLSFGKLRASYGIVGNDQIADYQYLSTYTNSGFNYQNISGLQPSRISNADFHWEVNKKLELAVELAFVKDRVLLTVNRYQSRSSNQLVDYAIPTITGFSSYQANLPAVVENTGWEIELNTKNIQQKDFSWSTSFNLTIPKNKLVSFQNFANSSYVNTLVVGQDITRVYGNKLSGIDPNSGNAVYAPVPGSTPDDLDYYSSIGKQTPDFYGGFGNTLIYKSWQLDIFGQFAKQMARGGINYTPGIFVNNYQYVLNRWQQPGDVTDVPKASTFPDYHYSYSSANFFDASYFRIKNISLSYSFPAHWCSKVGIDRFRIYAQGQNLYTWWHKNNPFLDPESGAYGFSTNLPPMRSIFFGTQITF
jgi:TonB-linked SusC/RagA family outer membrane protein